MAGVAAILLLVTAPACKKHGGSGTAGSQSGAAAQHGPKLEVDTAVHDFGTATEGDSLKHTFVLHNRGEAPLLIDRVVTSCGCTVAELKTKEIAPGASGEVEVTFDTKGRRGRNRKTITLMTNDPNTPRTTLEISALVETLLGFMPNALRANVGIGETQTVEAWLTGKLVDKAKLTIGKVEGDDSVKFELAEKKEGDSVQRGVRMQVKGAKVGFLQGKVTVSTGVEQAAEIEIPYNITVRGNVEVRPRALYFSSSPETNNPAGRERIIRVSSKKENFKLNKVRVVEGPFKAEILKSDAGPGIYEVRVTMQDSVKPDTVVNGKVELESNDANEPKIEVPLTVRSMPRMMQPPPGIQGGMPGQAPMMLPPAAKSAQ